MKDKELTPQEEVVVLRRCIGGQQKDINRLLKRITAQQNALMNRKKEVRKYNALIDWAIKESRFTKEECGTFVDGKLKQPSDE